MTNTELVKGKILWHYQQKKTLPSQGWLSKECGLELGELNICLRELVKDGFLSQYNTHLYVTPMPQTKDTSLHVAARASNLVKRLSAFIKTLSMGTVVRWVMFVIACVAIYISASFSYVWVSQFLEPTKAFLLSVSIVVYVSIAPEGAMLLLADKRYIISSLLIITALAALVFSMTMTTVGQYNIRSELLTSAAATSAQQTRDTGKMQLYRDQERDILASVDGLRKDLAVQQQLMSGYDTKADAEKWQYQNQLWKLSDLQRRIRDYEAELRAVREKIAGLIDTGELAPAVERQDFYTWFAQVSGVSPGMVEFVLYLVPALFCDIMAPLGLFVAFGLYRRKER